MTEWQGAAYHQHSGLQQAMAAEALGRLELRGNERVLDIGCGDGRITATIADRVPEGAALGVDPSHNMIDFANRQFAASRANLRFEVADARRLSYQREFDLITSFNALHWMQEQPAALAAIHSALKSAGCARLRFVSEGARKSLEDVIEEVRQLPQWARMYEGFRKPFFHFTPEEYRKMALAAGFQVAELNVTDHSWDFKSRSAFAAFAHATFVEWTQRLREEDRPSFISDVLDRYQQIATTSAADLHTFKFYQMEVLLTRH